MKFHLPNKRSSLTNRCITEWKIKRIEKLNQLKQIELTIRDTKWFQLETFVESEPNEQITLWRSSKTKMKLFRFSYVLKPFYSIFTFCEQHNCFSVHTEHTNSRLLHQSLLKMLFNYLNLLHCLLHSYLCRRSK